jgi:hypothetical protein
MKLKPSRSRQRLDNDESIPRLSEYTYRSRRSDEIFNRGRKDDRKSQEPNRPHYYDWWVLRTGLIIVLIIVIVAASRILSLSSTVDLIPLTNTGSSNLAAESLIDNKMVYQRAADKIVAASIWNRNKITIDTAKLSHELQAQFPDLSAVSVTVPVFSHQLQVYVEPTQLALVLQLPNGQRYMINQNGRAITKNPSSSTVNSLSLPVVSDQGSIAVNVGSQALTANSVSFIQTVIAQLDAKGYHVSSLTMPIASSELDVGLKQEPYIVRFNLEENDPRQQAGTFLAAINELRSQNITPAHYVDVRVDGRAYYQ